MRHFFHGATRHRAHHPVSRHLVACLLLVVGCTTGLESTAGYGRDAPSPNDSRQSRVGKRYPSERTVYRDERSGRQVVRLTSSPAEDVKVYQTHPSWTADGRWIVFRSSRTGEEQLVAVHEETGAIVQLTDEPGVQVGQVCLSRSKPELLTVIGDSVVLIRLRGLLEEGSGPARLPSGYRSTVGRIPPGARLSGSMSWDAAEKELYLGLVHPERPAERRWSISCLALDSGKLRAVIDLDFRVGHVQAHPRTAGLILYCHETGGDAPQRMWVVRGDGSGNRPFYRETFDEWVTHEVWWDERRSLFTVWPKNEAMRRKPHGIASVSLDGAVKFHSRFPYWHVTGAAGCRYGVGDTFDGRIFRVDLETGARVLLTQGHRVKKEGAHPHPTLHPGGGRVLFNSNAAGNADLYVVGLEREEE